MKMIIKVFLFLMTLMIATPAISQTSNSEDAYLNKESNSSSQHVETIINLNNGTYDVFDSCVIRFTDSEMISTGNVYSKHTNSNVETRTYNLSDVRNLQFEFPLLVLENEDTELSVYPNPANQWIKIEGLTSSIETTIYSLNGQIVGRMLTDENGRLSVEQLSAGVYVLKVENNAVKFIKR